ncbi:NAD(P)-dependent alcohol dehydrogenase, partial [Chamaesiphon sp. OTE_75_metabat_556]|uniref:NAD(P)-dependent alcohol dehydrogenase n=1 Tax=Chamaesiphon sp. OTE_75_metabat_556 TaxID=2964692 RepID=UPI00286B7CF1
DRVLGFSGAGMGCHAEYKCLPADGMVVLKPDNLSYEEAAAISFGGTTAWDFLRRGNLQSGEKVLVNGAAGCVGTAAVQLAKYLGADVTGVCSTANLELVQSLGADRAIDYTKEDFTANGQTYDIIVDTVGTAPFDRVKNSLTAGGRLLQILAGLPDILIAPLISMTGSKKAIAGPVAERVEDVQLLANLAAAGSFKPYIDRSYPFDRIAEAHSYVDTGHKKGNVVVTLEV